MLAHPGLHSPTVSTKAAQHPGRWQQQGPLDQQPATPADLLQPTAQHPRTPQQELGEQQMHFTAQQGVVGGALGIPQPQPSSQPPAGADKARRDYTRWTLVEEEIFYATLKKVAGQKPEKCLKEISQQLPNKDYMQVRHYYYRLLKRLNVILGEGRKLDSKNNLQVHQCMVKFWEVFARSGGKEPGCIGKPRATGAQKRATSGSKRKAAGGESEPAAVAASSDSIPGTAVAPVVAKRRKGQQQNYQQDEAKSPGSDSVQPAVQTSATGSHRSTSVSAMATMQGHSSGQVAGKLTVQLLPWDSTVEEAMQQAGYNPFLEITCSFNKSVLSVLKHLTSKWAMALPASEQQQQHIFLHPSHECPASQRSLIWGGPAHDPQLKIGDIYVALHCPAPFQLLYSCDASLQQQQPVAVLSAATARLQPKSSTPAAGSAGEAEGGVPAPQPSSSAVAAAQPTVSEIRRPRGLLGLLQQPSAAVLPAGKSPARPKQKKATGKGGGAGGAKRGKAQQPVKQQQEQVEQGAVQAHQMRFAPFHPPLEVGVSPFAWQQPQQQQKQATHPSGQKQQQHAAASSQWQDAAIGLNAHSLLNFLDAPTSEGILGISHLCTPGKAHGQPGVPPLPGSNDLVPHSWGSLSPPSNFHLNDSFDAPAAVLLPKTKDATRRVGVGPREAGGAAAACDRQEAVGGCALDLQLGPTDFSQLFATIDVHPAEAAAAAAPPLVLPAAAGSAGSGAATMAAAVDVLFGQAANAGELFGTGGAVPAAGPTSTATHKTDPCCNNHLLALPGDCDLDKLTVSFGSLLGVGDNPSWLQLPGAPPAAEHGSAHHHQQLAATVSERPFAALFEK